jgi:hypothetical protein
MGLATEMTQIMALDNDWSTKICFSISAGVWMTVLHWVIVREPWCSVFGLAMCLGWLLMDCMRLSGEKQVQLEEIRELEKQVVVLRSRLSEMARENSHLEVRHRRAMLRGNSERFVHSTSF